MFSNTKCPNEEVFAVIDGQIRQTSMHSGNLPTKTIKQKTTKK